MLAGEGLRLTEDYLMKSPFPGMDPYIEAGGLWADFHNHLIERIADHLADSAPERYLVRTGERSYLVLVEEEGKMTYPFLPDASITTPERPKKPSRMKGGAAVAEAAGPAAPLVLRAAIEEEHREAFVEIYEATPEQRLVTTVEVLSPSNKRSGSEGRDLYLRKRQSVMLGGVNLVEIDLLRGGERMPMLDPWPASTYTLMVARARRLQTCLVWPAFFREPLPVIRVPLAKPAPEISLDLQPMVAAIYRRYRYHQSIDYTKPLSPPLTSEDTAWLRQRLRERR
jgi:hypothetical protein